MLDLIVAKAMAKLLEDRYQTVKEFADDLREVRRQMDSSRPAAALKATTRPPRGAGPHRRRWMDTRPSDRRDAERPVRTTRSRSPLAKTLRLLRRDAAPRGT